MNIEKQEELQQFLNISQQMLGLAEKNTWDDLPQLEHSRQQLMQSYFKGKTISTEDSAYVEQMIKKVLIINEKIALLAEQSKQAISQQLHGMKKRQNVQSAYLENK